MLKIVHFYPYNRKTRKEWCAMRYKGALFAKPIEWRGEGLRKMVKRKDRERMLLECLFRDWVEKPRVFKVYHVRPFDESKIHDNEAGGEA